MKLLLLHAFPLDGRMWAPQRNLAAADDFVVPDLYRLGSSLGEWADAALRRVDGDFIAVGASMGGYTALEVAARAPDRLRGLVLVGSPATADPPESRDAREETIRLARERGGPGVWEVMKPRLVADDADATTVEEARALAVGRRPEELVTAVQAIRDRADHTETVRSLGVPLLVVVGEGDPLLPVETARGVAESAPQGRLEVIERARHLPSLERPSRFNAVLSAFLREPGS